MFYSRSTILIKKISAGFLVLSFFLTPVLAVAQTDPTGGYVPVGENDSPDAQAALQQRDQKDKQAAQDDAKAAQQKQQADLQKCQSQQGQTGSPLQNAIQQALMTTVSQVVTQTLPQMLTSTLQTSLNNEIQNSLIPSNSSPFSYNPNALSQNGGVDFRTQLTTELITQSRQAFNTNFINAVARESANGTQPLSNDRLKQLAQEALQQALIQVYPNALKTSFAITLTGDASRPGILQSLIQTNLPTTLNQTLVTSGPAVFGQLATSTFQTALGSQIFEITNSVLQNSGIYKAIGKALGLTSNNLGIDNSAIEGLGQQILAVLINILVNSLTSGDNSFAQIGNTLTTQITATSSDGSPSLLTQNINSLPITSIIQGTSGNLNGSIDAALRLPVGGTTAAASLEQQIIALVTQSFNNPEATAAFGRISDSMSSNAFSYNNNAFSTTGSLSVPVNALFQTQTVVLPGVNNLTNFVSGTVGTQVNNIMQTALGSSVPTGVGGVIGGTVGGLAGGLTQVGLNSITGQIGFGGLVVSQLSGPLTSMTSSMMTSIIDPAAAGGGVLNGIAGSLTGTLTNQNVLSGFVGGIGSGLTGTLTSMLSGPLGGLGPLGSVVSSVVSGTLGAAMNAITSQIVGQVAGALSGTALAPALTSTIGIFVPTNEQIGALTIGVAGVQSNTSAISATTKSTDRTIKDTNQLTIDICTKQKAMARMQAELELSRKVDTPQLVRTAATAVTSYISKILGFTQSGYKVITNGQTNQAPLFVTNTQTHFNNVQTEAKAVFMDALNNSGNIFKQQNSVALRQDDLQQPLQSTITRAEYNNFVGGQVTNSSDWWRIFQAINNPLTPDSPVNSERISRSLLADAEQRAIENAKQELTANQGYLPVRTCKEYTQDGQACKTWVTTTPAIQVKDAVSNAFAYRQNQYTNPQPGNVAPGNGPTLDELRLFQPATTGGGARGPNVSDIGGTVQLISSLLAQLQALTQTSSTNINTPSVDLQYSIPPVSAVETGNIADAITITWQGTHVTSCSAGNDWLGSQAAKGTILPVKNSGQDLGVTGQVVIPLPITFDLRYIRTRNGVDGGYQVTKNTVAYIIDTNTIGLPEPDTLTPGDFLSIRFYPYFEVNGIVAPITAGNANNPMADLTAAVRKAYTETNNTLVYSELSKYTPTYNTDGTITFTPNLTYTINCIADTDGSTVTKTIKVQAQ